MSLSLRCAAFFLLFCTVLVAKPIPDFMPSEEMHEVDYNLEQGKYEAAHKLLTQKQKSYTDSGLNMTQVYFLWSKYYYYLGELNQFERYAKMAYNTSRQTDNNEIKVYGIYALAYYYKAERELKKTIQLLQEIERLIDLDDDPYLAFYVYYRYYSIYTAWEDLEKTDYYTRKLIKTAKLLKNYHQLADAYIAKSFAMEYHYAASKSEVYKDSIRYYREKAAFLDIQYPELVGMPTESIAYLNLADYYTQGLEEGEYTVGEVKDSILKYTRLANKITPLFDKQFTIRGNILNLRSTLYKHEGRLDKAEKLLLEAYNNIEKGSNEEKPFYVLRNVSGALYDFYTSIEDYKSANFYLEKYTDYNDSIFNLNKISEINELEKKYETSRMRDKNEFLKSENEWNKTLNYLLITIFLLACLVLYFVKKNSQKKIALHKIQQRELQRQKDKIEEEALVAKKNEEKLISEKNQLHKEALASNLQIERRDKILQDIQDQLNKDENPQSVRKTLKRESRITKNIDKSTNEFEGLAPDFFKRLKVQSNDKLTPLDMKYCAYFSLNLDTKDIAAIFNVEDKSVRMTKYRIKRKLGLPKDQSLETFLNKLTE